MSRGSVISIGACSRWSSLFQQSRKAQADRQRPATTGGSAAARGSEALHQTRESLQRRHSVSALHAGLSSTLTAPSAPADRPRSATLATARPPSQSANITSPTRQALAPIADCNDPAAAPAPSPAAAQDPAAAPGVDAAASKDSPAASCAGLAASQDPVGGGGGSVPAGCGCGAAPAGPAAGQARRASEAEGSSSEGLEEGGEGGQGSEAAARPRKGKLKWIEVRHGVWEQFLIDEAVLQDDQAIAQEIAAAQAQAETETAAAAQAEEATAARVVTAVAEGVDWVGKVAAVALPTAVVVICHYYSQHMFRLGRRLRLLIVRALRNDLQKNVRGAVGGARRWAGRRVRAGLSRLDPRNLPLPSLVRQVRVPGLAAVRQRLRRRDREAAGRGEANPALQGPTYTVSSTAAPRPLESSSLEADEWGASEDSGYGSFTEALEALAPAQLTWEHVDKERYAPQYRDPWKG